MNQGFILLHRQLLDWEWYDHIPTKVLFIHCLLRANHTAGRWRGQAFKRGEFITSLNTLVIETGLTAKQVRTALDNLVESGELGKQTSNLNTLISVINYEKYQSKGTRKGKRGANEGQTEGKRRATDNNDNNDNNDKNEKEIYRSFDHLCLSLEEFNLINKNYHKHEIDSTLDAIENYVGNKKYKSLNLTLQNWLKKEYGIRDGIKQLKKGDAPIQSVF